MTAPLGVVTEYAHLRQLIAERRRELGLRQLEVDDLAGVQSGYTGKIECGLRSMGDMSMGALLGALGLHLVVMRGTSTHPGEGRKTFAKSAARCGEESRESAVGQRAGNAGKGQASD